MLEQREWRPYTGYVTKAALVRHLANIFWPEEISAPQFDCAIYGDQMICPVYAYPLTPGVAYSLNCSHGELSERVVDFVEYTETLQVSLESAVSTRYPVHSMLSYRWVSAEVWDSTGTTINPPAITASGKEITIPGQPVFGDIEVTYIIERHSYILTVDGLVDEPENKFSSTVFALAYGSRPVVLEIEPPPGADEWEAGRDDCAWGWIGQGSVTYPDEEDNKPVAAYADKETKIDYCTGEQLSSEVYPRVEWGDE